MIQMLQSVKIQQVTKLFDEVRALVSVSLEIKSGDVVAIMGSNGAGKSTLLSLISLAMRPTRGKILFNNEQVKNDRVDARSIIGVLSHQPFVYPNMTGKENLLLFAKLYNIGNEQNNTKKIEELEKQLELTSFFNDRPCGVLSRGQLQRVSLARALVTSPQLLLLDEPASGLDGKAIARIENVVNEHRENKNITVMVTHEPELAARVATRAVMLKNGKIVVDTNAPDQSSSWRKLYMEAVEGHMK